MMPESILIVDDEINTALLLAKLLQKQGFTVHTAFSYPAAVTELKKNVDLVLCDYRLGDATGGQLLHYIRNSDKHIPLIMMSGYPDIKLAVELARNGVHDYLVKPLKTDELLESIDRAVAEKVFPQRPAGSPPVTEQIIPGVSQAATEIDHQVRLIAPTGYNVVIYGASGTGKEHTARSIHETSDRRSQPFVALDCGTLSRELAASELFGYEAGAFTGAAERKAGYFEMADGGTLFLDEIGNLSYDVQALLLRIIQERKLKRVGGVQEKPIDVRLIVASNRDLRAAVDAGQFREDLYYRLNELTLKIPLLLHRNEDIRLFAEHFLSHANAETGKRVLGFDPEVFSFFDAYHWPGNIRELKNMVKRAALLATSSIITLKELPGDIIAAYLLRQDDEHELITMLQAEKMVHLLKGSHYTDDLGHILKALKHANYNRTQTAGVLNINRKTLYNRLRKACA